MDVPAGVTQEEGHTGFLIHLPSAVRALIFVARRIQPFLSLVDREVELWLCLYSLILCNSILLLPCSIIDVLHCFCFCYFSGVTAWRLM